MLTNSLILVTLKTSMWGTSVKDQSSTDVATDFAGAKRGEIKATKDLVGKDYLKSLFAIKSKALSIHKKHASPWLNDGQRLTSTKQFHAYNSAMAPIIEEFDREADAFCEPNHYLTIIASRPAALGKSFDPSDYPSVHEIRSKFRLKVIFQPYPDVKDWRLSMAEDQADAIKEMAKIEVQQHFEEASREPVDRTIKALKHLVHNLTWYKKDSPQGIKRLHESLVENVREMAQILPGLNFAQDPMLDKIAEDIENKLSSLDIDDLKESLPMRTDAASEAAEIIRRLTGENVSWS